MDNWQRRQKAKRTLVCQRQTQFVVYGDWEKPTSLYATQEIFFSSNSPLFITQIITWIAKSRYFIENLLRAINFRVDRERFANYTSRTQHHATECRDFSQDAFRSNHVKYGGKLMASSSISLNFLPRPLRKALLDFQKEGVKFGIKKQGR